MKRVEGVDTYDVDTNFSPVLLPEGLMRRIRSA